jgi:sorbitol-specific phosphotransferase system component IIBC
VDHTLNRMVINLIPFIIFIHGLIGIWGRTAEGVFLPGSFL